MSCAGHAADQLETRLDAHKLGADKADWYGRGWAVDRNVQGEAVTLLRAIRQAYYEDAKRWGMPFVSEDDARRFMRAYEQLMAATSPALHRAIMDGGPHSEPQHTTLEVP